MRINKVIHHNSSFYGQTTTIILADGYAYVMVTVMNGTEDVAAIHDVCVHKDRRGEGLGRELLECACEEARTMGAEIARLSTESGSWLEEWYSRHGFYKAGKDELIKDHTVMEKVL